MREILWALDPFKKERRVWNHSLKLLKGIAQKANAQIEPVYVCNPLEVRILAAGSFGRTNRISEIAQLAIEKTLRKTHLPNLRRPHIILANEQFSLSLATQYLAKYSARSNPLFILVGTQSRSGISRAFLGSFAETFLYHSKTPVFLVGRKMRSSKLGRVLFATDFSQESRRAFAKLCSLASLLSLEIVVHHAISEPLLQWGGPFLGQDVLMLDRSMKAQVATAKKKITSFAAQAKKQRIKVRSLVTQSSSSLGAEVLKQAKQAKADFVAVATQSGPARAALGSVAREVVRSSEVPVWIYPRVS